MSLTKVTSQMIDDDGVYGSPQGYVSNAAYLADTAANATGEQFSDEGAKIARIVDRLFVGGAATQLAGTEQPDTGTSWMGDNSQGPAYLLTNATLAVYPETCRYGIVAAANTSLAAGAGSAIALGSIIVNDGALPAWGLVVEVQHTTDTDPTWGVEFGIKNASTINSFLTPYNVTPDNVTIGIQLSGGGDDVLGPAATHPATAGIVFSTLNAKGFNTGIVFRAGSIPTLEAISFAQGYQMNWYENATGLKSGSIQCTNNNTANSTNIILGNNGINFTNGSNNSCFFISTASANSVNRIQVVATDTSNAPQVTVGGLDTNIDLRLIPKGTGNVRFGTLAATVDAPISGYIEIKDSGGTIRKLAVIS